MKIDEKRKSPTDPISPPKQSKNIDSERVRQQKHEARINRAYFDQFQPGGASSEVYQDLVKHFSPPSMKLVKVLADGSVDVNATMRNNGAFEVLSYIQQRIELGSKNQ